MNETASVINWLFHELKGIFPAFRQAWPSDDEFECAKKHWLLAIQEAGLTQIEQLKLGLKRGRASGRDFAPNPGTFIEWCRPTVEELGLPCMDEAFQIAIRMNIQFSDYTPKDEKVNSIIKQIINKIGSFDFRLMSTVKATQVFERFYKTAVLEAQNRQLKRIPEDPKCLL